METTPTPRILVIEDSPTQRRLLSVYLESIEADVLLIDNGKTGLQHALSEPFDLIISDIELPGENGLEICRRVNEECKPPIPVVLVSTLSSDMDIERGFEAGAAAYLPKPFRDTELLAVVNNILKKNILRRQQRILVVDDSALIRSTISKGLAEAGFHPVVATHGEEALRMAHIEKPSLILSDLNMPHMGGIDLCRALKRDPSLQAIPFVVMSANGDRGTMRRMVSMGAAAYLVKPFSRDQIVMMIEKLLDDHVLLMLKDKERAEAEREMMLASIMSLAQALEARDNYTSSHSKSVALVATAMAAEMRLSEQDMEAISKAAYLHDIGKIGISDAILLKPGRLTDEEFDTIRSHPRIGYDILKPITSLKDAMPAVLHHHEKWAGRGYPDGLAGEDIPLLARIVAVADVWHAVYSHRPYRPAMPREKALSIIREESGAGLCPTCVEVFFHLEREGRLPDVSEPVQHEHPE